MKVNPMKHLLGSEEIYKIQKVEEKVPLIINIFASGWEVKPAQKISKTIKTILLIFGDYCINTSKDRLYLKLDQTIRVIFTSKVFGKGSEEVRYNPFTSTLFFPDKNTMVSLLEKWGLPITLFDKYVWEKFLILLHCFYLKIVTTFSTAHTIEIEKEIKLSKFPTQCPAQTVVYVQPGLFSLKLAKYP